MQELVIVASFPTRDALIGQQISNRQGPLEIFHDAMRL